MSSIYNNNTPLFISKSIPKKDSRGLLLGSARNSKRRARVVTRVPSLRVSATMQPPTSDTESWSPELVTLDELPKGRIVKKTVQEKPKHFYQQHINEIQVVLGNPRNETLEVESVGQPHALYLRRMCADETLDSHDSHIVTVTLADLRTRRSVHLLSQRSTTVPRMLEVGSEHCADMHDDDCPGAHELTEVIVDIDGGERVHVTGSGESHWLTLLLTHHSKKTESE